jgi:hypothetical protein
MSEKFCSFKLWGYDRDTSGSSRFRDAENILGSSFMRCGLLKKGKRPRLYFLEI